jgi:hypothetical protein
MDQSNADPKRNLYRLEPKINREIYMDQSVKLKLGQGETRSVKTGRGVRKECCLSPILFTFYCEYFTKEALEGPGDFRMGGQVIRTVRYGDDLVNSPRKKPCNGT